MTGDLLTKPNKGSSFKVFRDLIMGVIIPNDTNNGKQGNRKKIKLIKVSKTQKRCEQRDRYHKLPQQFVVDRRTDSDKNIIRNETGYKSQKIREPKTHSTGYGIT